MQKNRSVAKWIWLALTVPITCAGAVHVWVFHGTPTSFEKYIEIYRHAPEHAFVDIGSGSLLMLLVLTVVLLFLKNRKLRNTLLMLDKAKWDMVQFKRTLDQTHDCVFMFAPDTLHFTYFNRGALNQTGYSAAELGQLTPYDIKPAFTEEKFRAFIRPLLDGEKETLSLETVHRRKDGGLIPVEINLQYVDIGNNEKRFVAIVRDITERKKTEQHIRDSEEQLRAIADNTVDGLITIDESGTIQSFNRACEKMFDYAADEAIGRNVNILMPNPHGRMHDNYLENYHRARKRKIIGIGREMEGKRKDGSLFSIDLSVSEVHAAGKKLYSGIIRDITKQKKIEAALQERQRMESLGALAGGLAHEINNALQPVLGLSEALRDRFHDKDEKLTHYMNTIYNNTMHARNIVRDVLTFARKEPKKKELLPMADTLKESVDFADEFLPSSIKVDTSGIDPGETPFLVMIDKTGLIQIIANLLTNASHAMNEKGTVKIGMRRAYLDREIAAPLGLAEGDYATISIVDHGCGMSKETMSHLFEPFFTTKPLGVGTGLGLAAVYGIIREWGGKITVNSYPGEGTEFDLYIPVAGNGIQLQELEDKEKRAHG